MDLMTHLTELLARVRSERDSLAASPLPRPRDVSGSSSTAPAEQRARILARKDASIARIEAQIANLKESV
jgi:hypothetical protein